MCAFGSLCQEWSKGELCKTIKKHYNWILYKQPRLFCAMIVTDNLWVN